MSAEEFVVPLADLERGLRRVSWEVRSAWLSQALKGTEAEAAANGELRVELVKTGQQVMVRGDVSAEVHMPCSRTLEPVLVKLKSEIFLLLKPAAGANISSRRSKAQKRAQRQVPQARGREGSWSGTPVLNDDDAAYDTYAGDQIVLDPFVREFILLELPMTVQKELPKTDEAAKESVPVESDESGTRPIDPRLLPLFAIANRMRNKE